MTRRSLAASLLAASLMAEPARIRPVEELNAALLDSITRGQHLRSRQLLDEGADPNATDGEGTPALMNAALYSTASHMKLLVERGANVNGANAMGATALIWAAGDWSKAKLLIDKGAEVNVQSKLGRTALMAAASVSGNAPTVKLLLSKGARVDLRDQIAPIPVVPVGGGKGTALIDAARTGDLETVRLLLEAGADVRATDARNGTALSEAVMYGRRDLVSLLLGEGAEATGSVTVLKLPYLTMAAMRGDVEVARLLRQHRADVNATDAAGNTPLMFAAAADHGRPEMVDFLLQSGARVNARNKVGETALDWALRRGVTPIVTALRAAGGDTGPCPPRSEAPRSMGAVPVQEAVQKALAALGKAAAPAFQKTGCASCHNHTQPMVAMAAAARKGIAVDTAAAQSMTKFVTAMLKPMAPALLEGSDVPPDIAVTGAYILEGLKAQSHPAGTMTAAVVHKVAQSQMADGRWVGWAPRAPMESGDIQATAMAIRTLRLYPLAGRREEMSRRIERARMWLMRAKPATTEEYIMRLEGLREGGASAAVVMDAAAQLALLQRSDGGWGQLPGLPPDAYATGKAVVALTRAGAMAAETAAVPATHIRATGGRAAALRFLRKTQHADGSWQVTTRSYPLQPLVDTGFPHGRDQWIAASGTSWAALALAMNIK